MLVRILCLYSTCELILESRNAILGYQPCLRCVKAAIEKLDGVDADAEKEKTQIVKDLAKDLYVMR